MDATAYIITRSDNDYRVFWLDSNNQPTYNLRMEEPVLREWLQHRGLAEIRINNRL